jgi:hypothetical protein
MTKCRTWLFASGLLALVCLVPLGCSGQTDVRKPEKDVKLPTPGQRAQFGGPGQGSGAPAKVAK